MRRRWSDILDHRAVGYRHADDRADANASASRGPPAGGEGQGEGATLKARTESFQNGSLYSPSTV